MRKRIAVVVAAAVLLLSAGSVAAQQQSPVLAYPCPLTKSTGELCFPNQMCPTPWTAYMSSDGATAWGCDRDTPGQVYLCRVEGNGADEGCVCSGGELDPRWRRAETAATSGAQDRLLLAAVEGLVITPCLQESEAAGGIPETVARLRLRGTLDRMRSSIAEQLALLPQGPLRDAMFEVALDMCLTAMADEER